MNATAAVDTGELCPPDQDEDTRPRQRRPGKVITEAAAVEPVAPPAVRSAADGLPDIEAHPGVQAARGKWAKLYGQFQAARDERQRVGAALGIVGTPTPARVEAVAAMLLAEGRDTAAIDEFESLVKAESRLSAACGVAAREVQPALDAARRAAQTVVVRDVLMPTRRELARAWLALVKAHRDHEQSISLARSGGFDASAAGLLFQEYPTDRGSISENVRRLLADGTLDAADAAGLI